MRVLGIDFGIKRVGLAVGSTQTGLVRPLGVIHRTTRKALWEELLAVIAREQVQAIALGYPALESGADSETCRQVRNFRDHLARHTPLPITLVNEAYTTAEALQRLAEAGIPASRRQEMRDAMAAVGIVESFLRQCSDASA
ncbi:putative pre-16S rRNA nuclease [Thermodesulfomicrobium sp. WS]|nr:putative pre-16S rRNA nuclease [Thermodesulfomicrobium sp. WS]